MEKAIKNQKKKRKSKKSLRQRIKRKFSPFFKTAKKTAVTLCILGVLFFLVTAFFPAHKMTDYFTDKSISAVSFLDDFVDKIEDIVNDIQDFMARIWSVLATVESTIQSGSQEEAIGLDSIPAYEGEPYVILNHNVPAFTKDECKTESFEYYSELDLLGRCGMTMACVSRDTMPTEERGAIGMVRPSGWKLKKYDIVDGKYIYNRCHLIGYQLTGENANVKNLITGTRYMNVEGMLPFENKVAEYVRKTGNHVMYRVTPIFEENNMVASGVLMEAYSVEDKGAGICFHVYVYNVQPGIKIDYATGETWLAE